MKILFVSLVSVLIFLPNASFAKDYKGFVCKYTQHGIDKCEGKGGKYKVYITSTFKNKSTCNTAADEISSTPAMLKKYPDNGNPNNSWIADCDKRW